MIDSPLPKLLKLFKIYKNEKGRIGWKHPCHPCAHHSRKKTILINSKPIYCSPWHFSVAIQNLMLTIELGAHWKGCTPKPTWNCSICYQSWYKWHSLCTLLQLMFNIVCDSSVLPAWLKFIFTTIEYPIDECHNSSILTVEHLGHFPLLPRNKRASVCVSHMIFPLRISEKSPPKQTVKASACFNCT